METTGMETVLRSHLSTGHMYTSGQIANSFEEIAESLRSHWEPIFTERPILAAAGKVVLQQGVRLREPIVQDKLSDIIDKVIANAVVLARI